jgi:anaerobic selenocysteine-containing dehydrogenase
VPVHYRACHLCEALCGVAIEHEGGAVTAVRGDPEDPFSQGHVCPKALGLKDLHEDPDRLRAPLRRVGSGWEEIGWEQALDEAAAGLKAVQAAHGRDSVAVYAGNPTVHNYGAILYLQFLIKALKTRTRFSATSVDQLPHHLAAYFLYGHQLLLPVPDLDRCRFLVVMGGNPAASNGSLMSAPGVMKRLQGIRERGEVVVIDPRRTETAAEADRHLFIRPGSDALLLAAMLHTLYDEERIDLGHLEGHVDGVRALGTALAGFTPEAVAPHTGIDPETTRGLARSLAAADGGAFYGRMGASTQPFGALCQWLISALNLLTGNLDRPGGVMFTHPAVDVVAGIAGIHKPGSYGRWRSRVRGLPEFGGELPVSAMAEEMLTPGEGRVRGLLTVAGNPALSTPNGGQLERALSGLEFMVSVDLYLNETTRHAHLILPPASPLERDHYDVVFNLLTVRDVARFSPALFEPPAGAKHDWQILVELEERLAAPGLRGAADRALRKRAGPAGILDFALRTGPRGHLNPLRDGLTLSRLKEAPHGLDLGPLTPCLPERLFTPDKRINLAPPVLMDDLPRLRAALEAPPEPLVLIGRRHLRSNNSWLHNSARLVKGRRRCTLQVHPDDAARLGLTDGEPARVRSRVGQLEAPVEVTDAVMPGVVSLPHGWGHGRQGTRLRVADAHPGVNINDLTDDQRLDPLSGNAALNGVPVEVSPAG